MALLSSANWTQVFLMCHHSKNFACSVLFSSNCLLCHSLLSLLRRTSAFRWRGGRAWWQIGNVLAWKRKAINSLILQREQRALPSASREFHQQPGQTGAKWGTETQRDAKEKRARIKKEKSSWTGWCWATSTASQAESQISQARSSAAWDSTAGAPCAPPPGD